MDMKENQDPPLERASEMASALFETTFTPYSRNDYTFLHPLAAGTNAIVCKIQMHSTGEYHAIKYPCGDDREKVLNDLKSEACILQLVSSPYIVRVIGFQFQEPYGLITEFCPRGTLQTFLANNKTLAPDVSDRLATEIIEALKAVHAKGIIHCDLKPANILLTADHHIKLADTGISFATKDSYLKPLDKKYLHHEIRSVPWKYAAPELLRRVLQIASEAITPAADIYSFGMVMWELFTRKEPYAAQLRSTQTSAEDIQQELCRYARILNARHSSIPKKWQDLIDACWNPIAEKRPSLLDITEKIYTAELYQKFEEYATEQKRLLAKVDRFAKKKKSDFLKGKMEAQAEFAEERKRLIADAKSLAAEKTKAKEEFEEERKRLVAEKEKALLGWCYYHGKGASKDRVSWYRLSAERGDASGQYRLGVCYARGEGVAQDKKEAVKWYRLSAEQGYAQGQFNLGACYHTGDGVLQDHIQAVKWYRLSAEQGNARAQYILGRCYARGDGVPHNLQEAVKWYLLAEKGDAAGQYKIGLCYDNGDGVTQDKQEAMKWYKLAAAQGNTDALKKLGRIRNNSKLPNWRSS